LADVPVAALVYLIKPFGWIVKFVGPTRCVVETVIPVRCFRAHSTQ
jgi:hypothetical protein